MQDILNHVELIGDYTPYDWRARRSCETLVKMGLASCERGMPPVRRGVSMKSDTLIRLLPLEN